MKTTRLLRVLSLLAFLLLMAPFYDTCNGHGMKQAEATEAVVADTTAVVPNPIIENKIKNITIGPENMGNQGEPPFYEKAYEFIDDENSENAFEFAKLNINCVLDFNYKDFKRDMKKKDGYKGIFFQLKDFSFLLIIITTILISIFSFKNIKRVHKLSKLNLILLSITIVCIFLEGFFETFSQFKWGYYAFIITNLLIFYYSKPVQKRQNS